MVCKIDLLPTYMHCTTDLSRLWRQNRQTFAPLLSCAFATPSAINVRRYLKIIILFVTERDKRPQLRIIRIEFHSWLKFCQQVRRQTFSESDSKT